MVKRKPNSYWLNLIEQCRNSGYMADYKNELENIESLMPWSENIKKRCSVQNKI